MIIILLLVSVFASFKLAEEKEQNKIIWAGATLLIGPFVLVVQYLLSWYKYKNSIRQYVAVLKVIFNTAFCLNSIKIILKYNSTCV